MTLCYVNGLTTKTLFGWTFPSKCRRRRTPNKFWDAIWLPYSQVWIIIEGTASPMLITAFWRFWPEGHREPCNEIGSIPLAEYLVRFEQGTLPIRQFWRVDLELKSKINQFLKLFCFPHRPTLVIPFLILLYVNLYELQFCFILNSLYCQKL